MSNKILEINNLEKSFLDPNKNSFKVLKNISLSIESGEILGLVGESGSGKTTLGRVIIRLLNSDSGQIIFNGQDITTLSKKLMRKVRKEHPQARIDIFRKHSVFGFQPRENQLCSSTITASGCLAREQISQRRRLLEHKIPGVLHHRFGFFSTFQGFSFAT